MIPVVTPDEMAGVDAAAPEPVEVLVERAGLSVARAARRMMGGSYGRTVVVVAGRGNNGADGRTAASYLTRWGAAVRVVDAAAAGDRLPPADLVIDAAYGTGLNRPYQPPETGDALVLAVDIPSGLSGTTGRPVDGGGAVRAEATVTFAAYKPGLLIGEGPDRTGEVEVADIGLGELAARSAKAWVVTDDDLALLPGRPRQTHKWTTAVTVVGGSPGMPGAPLLAATGAMRAGAGYAIVAVPGSPRGGGLPPGAHIGRSLPERDWGDAAAQASERAHAVVVGPGLGTLALDTHGARGEATPVARFLMATDAPAVVDADGLTALADFETIRKVADSRSAPMVLTPHDGEFTRISGGPAGDDRIAAVRNAASETGSVVLLKGSPTIVAEPGGVVYAITSGSPRLATAGTGDVLSGVIAAFLARGVDAPLAAALGAHCHGRAAALGPAEGMVASDLPDLVSEWLSSR